MNSSSIKVFKNEGFVVLSNIYNNSIFKSQNVFNVISTHNPHTLIINNLDNNALYYYIHKHNFPTVKQVIYFDHHRTQDTDGIYDFDKIRVSNHFNKHYTTDKFTYMSENEVDYYKSFTDKFDKLLGESLSITTSENSINYFDFIKKSPQFEIVEIEEIAE